MRYNFDQIIDRRHTNSLSIDGFHDFLFSTTGRSFDRPDGDFIRMWVADMDFAVPDVILDAVHARLDRQILGYTLMYDTAYYDALSAWSQKHYGWYFAREQLCISPGIVAALFDLTGLICGPGDKVLIFTPSYGPFARAARHHGLELVCSGLVRTQGGFIIDFDDFAHKAADPAVKLCIFCNPHNPTGRVWTREELTRVGEICLNNNVYLISDEIHCDLLRVGLHHTPMAACFPGCDRIITCTAPSKTFNIAGLMFSNIIIPDAKLRARWRRGREDEVNPLSLAAAEAAYRCGEEWLMQLRAYLDGNFALMQQMFAQQLPEARFSVPEATYLAWADVGAYTAPGENLTARFAEAGVVLESGNKTFVGSAESSIRLNLACPRAVAGEGLVRICRALRT